MSPTNDILAKRADELRIPMRGYEQNLSPSTEKLPSYESPCGVMSDTGHAVNYGTWKLRIPMRGYERFFKCVALCLNVVTNPHAGL